MACGRRPDGRFVKIKCYDNVHSCERVQDCYRRDNDSPVRPVSGYFADEDPKYDLQVIAVTGLKLTV